MGQSKRRIKKKNKGRSDSIGGKGASGALKSFHKPKTDLGLRQRGRFKLNDYNSQQQK
jgi:hypothetical protein